MGGGEFSNPAGLILPLLAVAAIGTGSVLGGSVFEGSQQEVDVKSFLSEICDSSSPLLSVTVKSFSVDHIDRSLEHICQDGVHGLLLWVSAENFSHAPELDSSRQYVGKEASANDFLGYCKYDVTVGNCTNEHGVLEKSSVMVLGEKYPERYELRDIIYKKWTNTTRLGSPILAYATLRNRDATYKYVDQDISYLSDTRIEFQLPATVNAGLPLSVFRGKTLAHRTISGETYYGRTFETINAVRYMSPHTIINVTVIGTEDRAYREFRGKLVTIYTDEDEAHSWARSLSSVEGASIETSLTDTRVEYGVVANLYDESQLPGGPTLTPNIPHTDHKYNGQPVVAKSENIHIHINELEMGQVYPGFRNFAIGAAVLVFSILGIALLDITRRILRERRAKRLHIGKYARVNGK